MRQPQRSRRNTAPQTPTPKHHVAAPQTKGQTCSTPRSQGSRLPSLHLAVATWDFQAVLGVSLMSPSKWRGRRGALRNPICLLTLGKQKQSFSLIFQGRDWDFVFPTPWPDFSLLSPSRNSLSLNLRPNLPAALSRNEREGRETQCISLCLRGFEMPAPGRGFWPGWSQAMGQE